MDFSIITPSFKQLDWLELCAASVVDQKGVTFEHIVQDGGSGDAIETWRLRHPEIKVSVETDAGMYDALNRGFAHAKGDIVAWLNCDEQYLPGTLERIQQFFLKEPKVDVVFGDAVLVAPNGSPLSYRRIITPRLLHTRLEHLGTLSCAMFFRRRVIENRVPFPANYRSVGDALFVSSLITRKISMHALFEPLATFTFTGVNLSQNSASSSETHRWRATFGWGAGYLRPVVTLEHRLRKMLAGAYRSRAVDYSIYTQASLKQRTLFRVGKLGWAWPKS